MHNKALRAASCLQHRQNDHPSFADNKSDLHRHVLHAYLSQRLANHQLMIAGCIQHAWKTYQASPHRAHRLAAVVRLQAGIRAYAARMHTAHLRRQQTAIAAMEAAMCCGSRSQLQSAAAQLVQAGALWLLISSTCCSLVASSWSQPQTTTVHCQFLHKVCMACEDSGRPEMC